MLPESSNTDISLFLDFGNVWGVDYDSSIDDSNKIRSSTGVSINWMSPLGPMTFVISENISKASTDKTSLLTLTWEQLFNMKFYRAISLILILALGTSNILNADIPHFLDFKYILNKSEAGSKAQSELKKRLDNGISNLKKKEKKLQEEEKKLYNKKKLFHKKSIKKKLQN